MATADFRQSGPTALQIEEQTRWEVESIDRGVRRYREFVENPNVTVADTSPGKVIMRDVMRPLIAAIEAAQAEARAGIDAGKAGVQPTWWWLIQFADADKLAFMTLREALAFRPKTNYGSAQRFSTAAIELGGSIQVQMDFDRWVRTEKLLSAEARKRGETRLNLFEALKRNTKKVDARAFKRWSTKINRLKDEPWTKDQKLQIGTKLLTMLIEHGLGWFELKMIPMPGGKTERYITISGTANEAITDIHSRSELSRPMLMPMICAPKPWQRA